MAIPTRSFETLNFERFKTKPYDHQLHFLNKYGDREYMALLAEMGTGKTWMIINNVAKLWGDGLCDSVLVLAPNGVHSNWHRIELPKHMPEWVEFRSVSWSSMPKAKDKKELYKINEPGRPGELRMLMMNWEALQTKKGFEFAKDFCLASNKLMIVCDESDSIKNPKAIRTKNLFKLKKYSKYRRIMTGTPINNSPFDAFTQFNFLDENILETSSYYSFKAEYAELVQDNSPLMMSIKASTRANFTPQIVARDSSGAPMYRNLEKLSALITPHSYRILKTECLDLPDKIYKNIFFKLTRQQEAIYKQAEEDCRLTFENEETPFNKLVSLSKLAQITSGYYLHPCADEPVRIEGDNPKLDILIKKVCEVVAQGEQAIVWARYRVEIADIVSTLRKEMIIAGEYHGGVSKEDRAQVIDDFESGKTKVFVGNQQAGGTGITLVGASHVIYFSNNFSLRDRLQSEDRAHRIGQTKNVIYINIAAQDTIDEKVIKALDAKKDVAREIIDRGVEFLK